MVEASTNALPNLLITNKTELIMDMEVRDILGNRGHRVNRFAINYRKNTLVLNLVH